MMQHAGEGEPMGSSDTDKAADVASSASAGSNPATASSASSNPATASSAGSSSVSASSASSNPATASSADSSSVSASPSSASANAVDAGAQKRAPQLFTRGISGILSRITSSQERHDMVMRARAERQGALTEQLVAQVAGNEAFAAMVQQSRAPYQRLMAYYRCAIMEAETKFRVLDEEFGLQHDRNPIESIKSRLKSPDSLARKMYLKKYPMTVESIERNIDDVAGVRVVCTFLEDMYALAEALLAQDDITLIERKDYIQNPKESGYRSLHLIIRVPIFLEHEKRAMKVEVQLRTIAENFWATLEHQLRYKKDISPESAAYIAQELTDLAETAASLDIRMQALRNYLDEES